MLSWRLPIEYHVLVHFVRHHHRVGVLEHATKRMQIVPIEHHAGRVVWRVHDDDSRARGHGSPHVVPVHVVVRSAQGHEHRRAAAELHNRRVRVIGGLQQYDFVAGPDQRG